jgi:hypothetical protein
MASTAQALPGPSSASFDKGAMFTVAGYTGSTLSGFPVLVRIAADSPNGFSYADLHNGNAADLNDVDIAFVGMDGTGLPFEIDTWNTEGESLIWVRLPTMANGTQFVMCWGSDSRGKVVCGTNPWIDYTGVWHMGETETASESNPVTIHDSTDNGLHGSTPVGEEASGSVVGGAWRIAPNNDHAPAIRVPATEGSAKAAADALGTDFHASFWFRAKGDVPWSYLVSRRKGEQGTGWGFLFHSGTPPALMRVHAGSTTYKNSSDAYNLGTTLSATDDVWKKLDVVWKYASNDNVQVADIYLNGVYFETVKCNETVLQQVADIGIGCSTQDAYADKDSSKKGRRVNGEMDEVRLGAFIPSADWIAADYATQSSASFLTVGTAEEYSDENRDPVASVVVSDVGYTNATVTTTVYSRGPGATSVDVAVELATSNDFASPLWTTNYTVDADNVAQAFFVTGLELGTSYYVRAVVSNDLNAVLTTSPAAFATTPPGPDFSVRVNTDYIVPKIFLSFGNQGLGSTVTQITIRVSSTGDFANPDLSKTFSMDLSAMPTNINDIALTGFPTSSTLYYRFTAVNSGEYATTVDVESANPVGDGNNVWSGLSEDIDNPDAYVFAGGLPAADKTLYFTMPAGLSPVINRDVAMPSLRFTNGRTEAVDAAYLGGYHSCGYDLAGTGVLTFDAETPILQASKGTNVVRNPILFNRSNSNTVYVTSIGGRLDLTGELMLPSGVTNTIMRVGDPTWNSGELHFGGPSPDFMGRLYLEHQFTLSLDNPNAMTNVSSIFFGDGWGSYTHLKNNTGALMTFPRCTKISNTTGWSNTRACYNGAPFLFPAATVRHYDRGGDGTKEADVFVKNLVVLDAGTWFNKYGNGTFAVAEETTWESSTNKHGIVLYGGCFWAQTDAGLPPTGEFYVPNDHVWQTTIGLSRDFYPTLNGSSTPRVFQTSSLANWGFTGFGGERTVCWNADPTLNLTNTTSGTVAIRLGDSAHTNVNGKAYSDYYAYPAAFVFGNRSEFADGTILFMNPIRYELGQEWNGKTVFESTNHVVAARLRGSLKLGSSNKTWNFSGRNFGGYLALEADNSDFTGRVNVHEKGNLLVNSNLVAQAVTVQEDSGLGGTGSIGTTGTEGTTVKSGGSLFGGEWNKGGVLTLNGKVTLDSSSALRAEVGASNDSVGCVKLASGSTLKLTSPIYVDVDTDPRVSPNRGASRKILDWSEASFASGAAPTRADFEVRLERNPDLARVKVSVRGDGLYVGYVSVRYPPFLTINLR